MKNVIELIEYCFSKIWVQLLLLNVILIALGGLSIFKTPFIDFFEICLQISVIMVVFEAILFLSYIFVLFIRGDFE